MSAQKDGLMIPPKGTLFRHYKGKMYRFHGLVRHSEDLGEMVHYEALYENHLGQFWVRPKEMFFGTLMHQGLTTPRFQRVESAEDGN